MLISSIFQTKEDGGQMDSELRVRTTYVSGSGIGIHFTLRIQSPRKKFVRGCEKFLPGSAWVLLSKTDILFSGALYIYASVWLAGIM